MNIEASFETIDKLSKIALQLLGEDKIQIIFEFGSRYGEDSIEFAMRYPKAQIYSFECNPNTLPDCKASLKQYKNILLTEKAVSNIDGPTAFFKIDPHKTQTTWSDGNQGASSLFKASGKYPIENYVQEEITVDSIRLSTFMGQQDIVQIDILWMDIQGAELLALQGLDSKINKVKIIHLEVEFFNIYQDQPLFNEVESYLTKYNFKLLGFSAQNEFAGDAIFINQQYFSVGDIKKAAKLLTKYRPSIFKKLIIRGKGLIKSLKNA